MAPPNSDVKILEQCQVVPATFNSSESITSFSLPLTFMDLLWLKFPPVASIFFYQLTESTPALFNSKILPKLKKSLSYALSHFLPLAGHLTWPQISPKPIISYTLNDAVSFTIAESNADFDHLSGNEIREAVKSHPYIPELPISDTKASILALQITLFPSKGFCISHIAHHAVVDGKTIIMFFKAWAYICKHLENNHPHQPYSLTALPDELTPSFDRSVIKDEHGLETAFLNHWLEMNQLVFKSDPRSLKVLPGSGSAPDLVRATFELTREDINFLRKKVLSYIEKEQRNQTEQMHASTFVLASAFTLACVMKAKGDCTIRKVFFVFAVDLRSRLLLDPPIPKGYFGNCLAGQNIVIERSVFMEENGVALIAERLSGLIKGLNPEGLLEGEKDRLLKVASLEEGTQFIGISGLTRFNVYKSDFGWGEPKMVEITSIDKSGSISMVETRGETGGVEIGLALKMREMEAFSSLFVNGLKG